MTPSVVILAAICLIGWFVAMPFVVADSADIPLWQGFAVMWGVPLGIFIGVAALRVVDLLWLRRKDRRDA
jgi:hypothetical protein